MSDDGKTGEFIEQTGNKDARHRHACLVGPAENRPDATRDMPITRARSNRKRGIVQRHSVDIRENLDAPAAFGLINLGNLERAEGARGVQVFTNVNGMPLDDPSFRFDLARVIGMSRVASGRFSAGPTRQAWRWRASFSGLFDKLPGLTIITHHLGAMIPYFEGRVGPLWDQLGSRTARRRLPSDPCRDGRRENGRSTIFGCFTTIPPLAAHSRRSGAALISSGPNAFCSGPISIRPRGRTDVHPRHDRRARWIIAFGNRARRCLFGNALKVLKLDKN